MHYPFVPFPMRGPTRWPRAKQLPPSVTSNLEYWDLLEQSPAVDHAGSPAILLDLLPGNNPDFSNFARREYGQRRGDNNYVQGEACYRDWCATRTPSQAHFSS